MVKPAAPSPKGRLGAVVDPVDSFQSLDRPISTTNIGTYIVLALCSIVDGFDLQSTGLIGPQVATHFHLNPGQLGFIFGVTALGLALGSAAGGWLADLNARSGLIAALFLVAVPTLVATVTPSTSVFTVMRFLSGLGVGAVVPLVVLIATTVGSLETTVARIPLLTTGVPFGGLVLGVWIAASHAVSWQLILQVGGWTPLLLAFAAAIFIRREVRQNKAGRHHSAVAAPVRKLFQAGRTWPTSLVWTVFVLAHGFIYILAYWLPYFFQELSFQQRQIGLGMTMWSIGAVSGGVLLGSWSRFQPPTRILPICYASMMVVLTGIAILLVSFDVTPNEPAIMFLAIGILAFFTSGSSLLLYGIVPSFFVPSARGTGVGSSLAMGKVGGALGPMLVGWALAYGGKAPHIFLALAPAALLLLGLTRTLLLKYRIAELTPCS